MTAPGTPDHWDDIYAQGDTTRSWYQERPEASLRVFDGAGVTPPDSVLDIGGGASVLVDALLDRGHTDITVMDISDTGLVIAQHRLGTAADRVQWLWQDVLTWRPPRQYRVWHDRAVFHFLTTDEARTEYRRVLSAGTLVGSVAVFGTFALDGPTHCSGLPVTRYGPTDLAAEFGPDWELITTHRENHRTPNGAHQPFTWAAFRRHR